MFAVLDVNSHDLAALYGLNRLYAAGRLDLALGDSNYINATIITPSCDEDKEPADGPNEPHLYRRQRRLKYRQCRWQKFLVGAPFSH
jgi:hypothetical protein